MKQREERNQKPNNVEFGIEFGDMNASKIYEIPFAGKKNRPKGKKEK